VDDRRTGGPVDVNDAAPSNEVRALRDRVAELEALEAERERSEKVQAALYRIAETASAAQDMHEFYAAIHRIVGELMYAKPIRPEELVAALKGTPRWETGSSTPPAVVVEGSIDRSVLARLVEGAGGDAGFVSELIEQFVADTPGLVAAARSGLEKGDADKVRRAAHTLKSNAATFGAHGLAEHSRSLEQAAKRGALDDAPAMLEAMAHELDVVREALPAAWRGLSARA